MTITDDEIKAARALCEAATPGPWTARFDEYVIGDNVSARVSIRNDDGAWVDSERTIVNESMRGDAAFIAAARTLVPRLLDEDERLKAALAEAVDIANDQVRQRTNLAAAVEGDAWRMAALRSALADALDALDAIAAGTFFRPEEYARQKAAALKSKVAP